MTPQTSPPPKQPDLGGSDLAKISPSSTPAAGGSRLPTVTSATSDMTDADSPPTPTKAATNTSSDLNMAPTRLSSSVNESEVAVEAVRSVSNPPNDPGTPQGPDGTQNLAHSRLPGTHLDQSVHSPAPIGPFLQTHR